MKSSRTLGAAPPVLVALVIAAVLASLAIGCGMGDRTLEEVDPNAVPATPDYTTDVAPILRHYCTHCHSADAQTWSIAGPYFDSQGESEREACRVWSTIDDGYMPPGALDRLDSSELLTVQRWASQRGCIVGGSR